jgi:hypothetical protein
MNIFKLNNKEIETLREWGKTLASREKEARESLVLENCKREFCELFQINNDWYIAMHMESSETLPIVPPDLNRPLDKEHREILKKIIANKIKTETIYDIKA